MKKSNLNELVNVSKKILNLLYFILIVVGIYLIFRIIKELNVIKFIISFLKIMSPLFIGIVIAWLFNPFVKFLEKKKIRRSIGTTLSYVILFSCIFLIVNALIPLIYNQAIELISNFPKIVNYLKEGLEKILSNFDSSTLDIDNIEKTLFSRIDVLSKNLSNDLPKNIIGVISIIVSSIGTFIIGLVIGFFLLLSCNDYTNSFKDFIPKKYYISLSEIMVKINISLRNYVSGAAIDAFVVFIISSIVFAIIGLKAPLLFGIFCGLMNVIPYAGPYIGGAPAVIVAFSQGTGIGIAILIAIIIIQTIEGNLLQTIILSKTTKLHPVTIIMGLLIFGYFFGIIGMLISTPAIGVLKVIIKYFDEKYDLLNFN